MEIKGEERRTEKEGNNRKQKVECSRKRGEMASSSCKLNIGSKIINVRNNCIHSFLMDQWNMIQIISKLLVHLLFVLVPVRKIFQCKYMSVTENNKEEENETLDLVNGCNF